MQEISGRAWIRIITSIGAFAVAGESIYYGYKLFLIGATGGFTIYSTQERGIGFYLASTTPGIGFAACGVVIAVVALFRLIEKT